MTQTTCVRLLLLSVLAASPSMVACSSDAAADNTSDPGLGGAPQGNSGAAGLGGQKTGGAAGQGGSGGASGAHAGTAGTSGAGSGQAGSAGTAGQGGAGSAGGPAGSGGSAGSAGSGGGGPLACSEDQTQVMDGSGKVVATCASTEGCAGGKCIAACDAAAQSASNAGCEFYAATPRTYYINKQGCFAAFLVNNSTAPAKLTVTRGAASYDVTKFGVIPSTDSPDTWAPIPADGLPPGEVAILFLSSDPNSVLTETGESLGLSAPHRDRERHRGLRDNPRRRFPDSQRHARGRL
jgi:hypothetical protein